MSADVGTQVIDILVTGLAKSGKSTLIHTISQKIGQTEGWTAGHLPIDDLIDAQFLEPPADFGMDFIWLRDMIEQTDLSGYIVVCDGARPELFGETVGLLQAVRYYHPQTPLVLAVNKQDHPQAWSADDVKLVLSIPDEIPVLPCVATSASSVRDVILKLLTDIWNA